MAQNALDDHIRHAESVEIGPKSAPRCMPTMPVGQIAVPLVFMPASFVVCFCLAAPFAAVQSWEYDTINNTGK
jgi:hypothetical protein